MWAGTSFKTGLLLNGRRMPLGRAVDPYKDEEGVTAILAERRFLSGPRQTGRDWRKPVLSLQRGQE